MLRSRIVGTQVIHLPSLLNTSTLEYVLDSQEGNGLFEFVSKDQAVFVAKSLVSASSSLLLQFSLFSEAGACDLGQVAVMINIVDDVAQAPEFPNLHYVVSLGEDASIGTVVFVARAIANASVKYSLSAKTRRETDLDPADSFAIDEDTGFVTTVQPATFDGPPRGSLHLFLTVTASLATDTSVSTSADLLINIRSVSCKPGTVSPSGTFPCEACPMGTFQSEEAGNTCNECSCPPGMNILQSCDSKSDNVCAESTTPTTTLTTTNALSTATSSATTTPTTTTKTTTTTCHPSDIKVNGLCTPIRHCSSLEFEVEAPTSTSNRVCMSIHQCNEDSFYNVSAASCQLLTVCDQDEIAALNHTYATDRVCRPKRFGDRIEAPEADATRSTRSSPAGIVIGSLLGLAFFVALLVALVARRRRKNRAHTILPTKSNSDFKFVPLSFTHQRQFEAVQSFRALYLSEKPLTAPRDQIIESYQRLNLKQPSGAQYPELEKSCQTSLGNTMDPVEHALRFLDQGIDHFIWESVMDLFLSENGEILAEYAEVQDVIEPVRELNTYETPYAVASRFHDRSAIPAEINHSGYDEVGVPKNPYALADDAYELPDDNPYDIATRAPFNEPEYALGGAFESEYALATESSTDPMKTPERDNASPEYALAGLGTPFILDELITALETSTDTDGPNSGPRTSRILSSKPSSDAFA